LYIGTVNEAQCGNQSARIDEVEVKPVKNNLDPAINQDTSDWEGNNAAFTCPRCGKIFIVCGGIHNGKRSCPKCGESTGIVTDGRKTGGAASITWEEA
jgi:endogenous inhibitor of DNA gyrase (YacG/DUF329 family)